MSDPVKDYPPYLDYPKPRKKQTNADKIRAMTDEELAEHLARQYFPPENHCKPLDKRTCYDCWLDWLKREVPAPPQKKPLCDDCKHAIDGVVDDFATVFCATRLGYFGQVTECKDYAPTEVSGNGN